jgi:hypothetical protein
LSNIRRAYTLEESNWAVDQLTAMGYLELGSKDGEYAVGITDSGIDAVIAFENTLDIQTVFLLMLFYFDLRDVGDKSWTI